MNNHLKELRARDKLTQDDLAKKVGVTRQTILAIENGKYNPSLELAFNLSNVFKAKIEEMFEAE
ncbi:helix-turn-helix transcriptional regulator [Candidatus Micrarchaeota archaeon]|nr:helix-turn-helix transcriptional regulator [Candidatus Micrarchaeota archaeon]